MALAEPFRPCGPSSGDGTRYAENYERQAREAQEGEECEREREREGRGGLGRAREGRARQAVRQLASQQTPQGTHTQQGPSRANRASTSSDDFTHQKRENLHSPSTRLIVTRLQLRSTWYLYVHSYAYTHTHT